MDDGAVETLGIVLDDELPIRLQMIDSPFRHPQFFHSPALELAVESCKMFHQGTGPFRKIDEYMAIPNGGGDILQRIVGFAESFGFFHMGSMGQGTVEIVSPGVVRALDHRGKGALILLAKQSAAMAADIVE